MVQEPLGTFEEIRDDPGRSDNDARHPRLAVFDKELFRGIESFLAEQMEWIRPDYKPVEADFNFPSDAPFKFFNRDISPYMEKAWPHVNKDLQSAVAAYEWVTALKPDGVLVWTDAYPDERAAVLAAKDLGIPSIEIEHGQVHTCMHGHYEVNQLADFCLSTYEYLDFHKFYRMGGEVIATGSPKMDIYSVSNIPQLRLTSRSELKIPEHVPVITWIGTWVGGRSAWDDDKMRISDVVEFLKVFKILQSIVADVHLIFKSHPTDSLSLEEYEVTMKELGIEKNYTLIDDNLPLSIAPTDLTVGPRSSAMVTGLSMGIPALLFEDQRPFIERGKFEGRGFQIARSNHELLSKLTHILTDKDEMIDLIREAPKGAAYFGGGDGKCNIRCARAIKKIVQREEVGESCWGPLP